MQKTTTHVDSDPWRTNLLTMGEICKRIAPLSITVEGLRKLGIEPAEKDYCRTMYRESDWQKICQTLIYHIEEIRTPF
jgi:hypothetical protein